MPSSPPLPLRRFLAVSIVAVLLAHLLDGWAYANLTAPHFAETDLGRFLRIQGFLPTWMVVGAALVLHDWPRRLDGSFGAAWRRGALVVGSAALGGGLAEVVKILVRRLRPAAGAGEYLFRPWSERTFSTAGLGMPSSHVLVAFGALAMLVRLFPRARPVWYLLAAGCAYSRVAAGAHFLSDVTVAAVLGIGTAEFLVRRFSPPATP